MKPRIRTAEVSDASAVSTLVQLGFDTFVAGDWQQEACSVFAEQSSAERFAELIPKAAFAAVAEEPGRILGVILLPTPRLLAFLFVSPERLRQGLGSALWVAARAHLEANHPDVTTVELNSSPYAVPVYRALGFYPISEPFRRGGCLATRMACWLPGRSLARLPESAMELTLHSKITCPACGGKSEEEMPEDACIYFYECKHCQQLLKPLKGDCCVFCSFGTAKCPPMQLSGRGCCA